MYKYKRHTSVTILSWKIRHEIYWVLIIINTISKINAPWSEVSSPGSG